MVKRTSFKSNSITKPDDKAASRKKFVELINNRCHREGEIEGVKRRRDAHIENAEQNNIDTCKDIMSNPNKIDKNKGETIGTCLTDAVSIVKSSSINGEIGVMSRARNIVSLNRRAQSLFADPSQGDLI